MIACIEKLYNISDQSDEQKLAFFERKYAIILRKYIVCELTPTEFDMTYKSHMVRINFYRSKLGLIDYETEMDRTSILEGGNLVMDGGDPNELLMINPDLFKYSKSEDFYKIPIIVKAPVAEA
jgi:hypothetical protein